MLRINDRLLQRFEEQLAPKEKPAPVAPGFELRHGYLAMTDASLLQQGMLLASDLPIQQRFLAAIEVAAPLVMAWHLVGLQRWGQRLRA